MSSQSRIRFHTAAPLLLLILAHGGCSTFMMKETKVPEEEKKTVKTETVVTPVQDQDDEPEAPVEAALPADMLKGADGLYTKFYKIRHVRVKDLVRLVNHLAGSRPLRTAALFLADIDQDLLVTGRDLEALAGRVVGAGP